MLSQSTELVGGYFKLRLHCVLCNMKCLCAAPEQDGRQIETRAASL